MGEMSLVGPRPHEHFVVERYEDWHRQRFHVRPSITCIWQIQPQRHRISFDEWMRMDLDYIEHWSFWRDITILVRTALLACGIHYRDTIGRTDSTQTT